MKMKNLSSTSISCVVRMRLMNEELQIGARWSPDLSDCVISGSDDAVAEHLICVGMQVICLYITGDLETYFSPEHCKEVLRFIFNHQNDHGGWGIHVEGKSTMFSTVLNYLCLRLLGECPEGGQKMPVRELASGFTTMVVSLILPPGERLGFRLRSESVTKFYSLTELIPEQSRVTEDGMYRAIDIYLKRWHPDRCPVSGNSEQAKSKFQAIQHAYSVLSDEKWKKGKKLRSSYVNRGYRCEGT